MCGRWPRCCSTAPGTTTARRPRVAGRWARPTTRGRSAADRCWDKAMAATRHPLPHERQHFQHGPIDLIIGADGDVAAVQAAHDAAWQRFEPILAELVAELP